MKLVPIIRSVILIIVVILNLWIFSQNFNTQYQHFSEQSQSFLRGRLDIAPQSHDTVVINGLHYWPQGPFPSIALMPFQKIFGGSFNQSVMQIILVLIITFCLYKLSRIKNFSKTDSIFLSLVFLIGSPIIGLITDPRSWFFAQVITVTLLLLLLLEFETKKRYLILGLLIGALFATRPTSVFIALAIFYLVLVDKKINLNQKIKNLILFIIPILIFGLFLGWINQVRFGNPLDNGYLTNEVGGVIGPLREEGIFSLSHIPTNFYYYFLSSIDPIRKDGPNLVFPFYSYNIWGLSFFLLAPFFIYSFKSLKNNAKVIKPFWAVIILTLFSLLCYYAPGWYQFGPRYTTDFLPILFILTLHGLNSEKLTNFQKNLICLSVLINTYLLISIYLIPK